MREAMRLASDSKTWDTYDCIHSLTDDREVEEEHLTIHRQSRRSKKSILPFIDSADRSHIEMVVYINKHQDEDSAGRQLLHMNPTIMHQNY